MMMLNSLRFSALRHTASTKPSFFCLRPTTAYLFSSSTTTTKGTQRNFSTTGNNKSLIINAVGNDRLGIVSDMAKFVTDAGGNVGESQAARLGSHFSLMMMVSVPESQVQALVEQLRNMKDMNASVFVSNEGAVATPVKPKIGYTGCFRVEGADHTGIVHKVTTLLSQNGLSIEKMETSDEIAPQGGTVLFKMVGIAKAYEPIAAGFDSKKVNAQLEALGDDLNCDIYMEDV